MKTKQTRPAWAGFKTAEEGNAKLMQRPMVLALVYCHWPIDIGLFALAMLLAIPIQCNTKYSTCLHDWSGKTCFKDCFCSQNFRK